MPTYDYECENCGYSIADIYQSIKSDPLTLCEHCGTNSLVRILYSPHVFVKGDPTTLGQLAERNTAKMGKTMVQEKNGKDQESKKTALKEAKSEIRSQINKMNSQQKRRYIEDGK